MKTLPIQFKLDGNNIEMIVLFDVIKPVDYTVQLCKFNGQNVTDFYNTCKAQGDDMMYPQIVEAIVKDMYSPKNVKKEPTGAVVAQWAGTSHLNQQTH